MNKQKIVIEDFAKSVMIDEKLRSEFLSASSPSLFLQSRAGIVVSENQGNTLKKQINELKEKYANKKRAITGKERKIFGISVPFEPFG